MDKKYAYLPNGQRVLLEVAIGGQVVKDGPVMLELDPLAKIQAKYEQEQKDADAAELQRAIDIKGNVVKAGDAGIFPVITDPESDAQIEKDQSVLLSLTEMPKDQPLSEPVSEGAKLLEESLVQATDLGKVEITPLKADEVVPMSKRLSSDEKLTENLPRIDKRSKAYKDSLKKAN